MEVMNRDVYRYDFIGTNTYLYSVNTTTFNLELKKMLQDIKKFKKFKKRAPA